MKPLLLTLNLMLGADAASSHYALQHGAHELILSQRPVRTDAIIAIQGAWVSVGLLELSRRHPKAAKVLGWTFVGIRCAVVARNLQQVGKLR